MENGLDEAMDDCARGYETEDGDRVEGLRELRTNPSARRELEQQPTPTANAEVSRLVDEIEATRSRTDQLMEDAQSPATSDAKRHPRPVDQRKMERDLMSDRWPSDWSVSQLELSHPMLVKSSRVDGRAERDVLDTYFERAELMGRPTLKNRTDARHDGRSFT